MAKNDSNQPIIVIKKKVSGGHGGHHGGSWKVAYADFVTAMMAFFMLLWLLNVTTVEQKQGIADYFAPTFLQSASAGASGLFGGSSVEDSNKMVASQPGIGMTLPKPQLGATQNAADNEATRTGDQAAAPATEHPPAEIEPDELAEPAPAHDTHAEDDKRRMERIMDELRQTVEGNPELAALSRNLLMEMTPEGLRIQLVDQGNQPMFPTGDSRMYEDTRALIAAVARVAAPLPNSISIAGHTDSAPFRNQQGYGNWELSSERANASRRALVESGLPEGRILEVVGRADREPILREDPTAPVNRRISLLLLTEEAEAERRTSARAAASPTPAAPTAPATIAQ